MGSSGVPKYVVVLNKRCTEVQHMVGGLHVRTPQLASPTPTTLGR